MTPVMKKYKYRIFQTIVGNDWDINSCVDKMNELGKNGWEIIETSRHDDNGIDTYYFVVKKEIKE